MHVVSDVSSRSRADKAAQVGRRCCQPPLLSAALAVWRTDSVSTIVPIVGSS